jgi:hypothetical protein
MTLSDSLTDTLRNDFPHGLDIMLVYQPLDDGIDWLGINYLQSFEFPKNDRRDPHGSRFGLSLFDWF